MYILLEAAETVSVWDSIGNFFTSIGNFFKYAFDAVHNFLAVVGGFFGNFLLPVINFFPSLFGNQLGGVLNAVFLAFVALCIWEAIN